MQAAGRTMHACRCANSQACQRVSMQLCMSLCMPRPTPAPPDAVKEGMLEQLAGSGAVPRVEGDALPDELLQGGAGHLAHGSRGHTLRGRRQQQALRGAACDVPASTQWRAAVGTVPSRLCTPCGRHAAAVGGTRSQPAAAPRALHPRQGLSTHTSQPQRIPPPPFANTSPRPHHSHPTTPPPYPPW